MSIYYQDDTITLLLGDASEQAATLAPRSVQTVVTSPPYFGLRDYGVDGQLGAEESPAAFVANLVAAFEAIRPALADDGTLWVNLGDSYVNAGGSGTQGATGQRASRTFTAERRPPRGDLPAKNLLGIPWRFAFAMQDAGWILRNDIIWAKPNGMPESVRDRFSTKHEHLFLFAKSPRYYFDLDAVRSGHVGRDENGKNPGDVWTMATRPFSGAHFATFPPDLPERCIKASTREGDTVLDPFSGSGTTGMVANKHGRKYVGIDLSADYHDLALKTRLAQGTLA